MGMKSHAPRAALPARPGFKRALLAGLIAAGLSSQAQSLEFQIGEIQGRLDSNISVGASWRLKDPSPAVVSPPNGGTSLGSGSYDDGTQNFKKGETFSRVFKGLHELDLRYENFGAFVRGKYWYDFEGKHGSRAHGHSPNGYVPGARLNDRDFNSFAKFSGAELLDAYVYGFFDVGGKPLDLRLGRQVVNWGESTFIQGGINVINPVDVSAFRRPGAELREGLLPVNMAFASLGLTDNLSAEAFYQFKWEPTAVDGCGTYFSSNDFAPQGCNGIRVGAGTPFAGVPDRLYFNPAFTQAAVGFDPVVYRHANGRREAKDSGQFGVAFRYFAEELNNTEFGLYFTRYHSRLPMISGVNTPVSAGQIQAAGQAAATSYIMNNAANPLSPTPAEMAAAQATAMATIQGMATAAPFSSTYFVSYPENIDMLGLSFNTNLGDIAWSGEISHKRDVPVQINGPLLVGAILRQFGYQLTGQGIGNHAADQLVLNAGPGATVPGYSTFDVTQAQTTFIKFYDNVLGASRLATVAELGWTHVHGLDEGANALKYGRNGVYGYAAGDTKGFVTKNSFGYVLRGSLEYPNAFSGVTLIPEASFRHGVKGYGPEPGAAFREGERSINLGLTGEYMNKYSVGLSYTSFFGGKFNADKDRDFIALSASVAF